MPGNAGKVPPQWAKVQSLLGIDPDLDRFVELEVLVGDERLRVRLRRRLERDQALVDRRDLRAVADRPRDLLLTESARGSA